MPRPFPWLEATAAVLCVAIGLLCLRANSILYHADAIQYLSLGRSLAAGTGYHSPGLRFPVLMQPPLYPLLIAALVRMSLSPVVAAVTVCIGAQALTLWGLLRLHRLLFAERGLMITAAVACVYPNLAFGALLLLEPVFLCALCWAVYFALSGLLQDRLARLALSGLCLALSFLARPEGILTTAVLLGGILLYPPELGRRALRSAVFLLAVGGTLLPYGLWMRARLHAFDVLTKLRYNLPFADVLEHMDWGPGEERLGGREMRAFWTLMPDRSDFVMNYAFDHPTFDPRTQFPRRVDDRGPSGGWRPLLGGVRAAAADAVGHSGMFHPLALFLLCVGVYAALRRRRQQPREGIASASGLRALFRPECRQQWLPPLGLFSLVGVHTLPALVSGADYQERYLAASLMFSVPLVAFGAVTLAEAAWRRWPRLPAAGVSATLAALLVLAYGAGTYRLSRGRPAIMARADALLASCRRVIPAGTRVMEEHARATFLSGNIPYQMPYLRSRDEAADFVSRHGIDYVILDTRDLLRNPSPVNRALADPGTWPAGWRVVVELFSEKDPIRIVKTR